MCSISWSTAQWNWKQPPHIKDSKNSCWLGFLFGQTCVFLPVDVLPGMGILEDESSGHFSGKDGKHENSAFGVIFQLKILLLVSVQAAAKAAAWGIIQLKFPLEKSGLQCAKKGEQRFCGLHTTMSGTQALYFQWTFVVGFQSEKKNKGSCNHMQINYKENMLVFGSKSAWQVR